MSVLANDARSYLHLLSAMGVHFLLATYFWCSLGGYHTILVLEI